MSHEHMSSVSIDDESVPLDLAASREERRTTGRIVAVVVALSLILLAMYHAWVRKTAVLAGVIIPALIMVLYIAWVLYTAKRDKYKRNVNETLTLGLANIISTTPQYNINPSQPTTTTDTSRKVTDKTMENLSHQNTSQTVDIPISQKTQRKSVPVVKADQILRVAEKKADRKRRKRYLVKQHASFNKFIKPSKALPLSQVNDCYDST